MYDFMQQRVRGGGDRRGAWPGSSGYFLVLRGQTFAGHALSHVGFTGATGAVLLGLPPLWGLVLVTVAGGVGMGLLGERLAQRDVAIGIVLALSLGFGLLFLHFFTAVRDAGDGAAVRQRAGGRCRHGLDAAGARRASVWRRWR